MTTDKQARKDRPIASGVLDYFPDAIAEVAHVSCVGGKQHNTDGVLRWDRSKSPDHADCLMRHLLERGTLDTDGLRHSAKVAWRALALLQVEIEKDAGKPTARTAVYLAGPMRGYYQNNFPAFHMAAALGRSLGFEIISPAEEDLKVGVNPEHDTFSLAEVREFARRDVDLVFQCRALAVLPGWEASTGCAVEVALARMLSLPILDATTFKALEA